MQAVKEKVSDLAASAKAGMEKSKAVLEEKREKIMTKDQARQTMATQKKEERIDQAERQKQMAYAENAAARYGTSWSGSPTTIAAHDGRGLGTRGAAGYTSAEQQQIFRQDQM